MASEKVGNVKRHGVVEGDRLTVYENQVLEIKCLELIIDSIRTRVLR